MAAGCFGLLFYHPAQVKAVTRGTANSTVCGSSVICCSVVLRVDCVGTTSTLPPVHVRRAKSGDASVHPISARESRALRKLLREAPTSPYVFISERHAPLSVAGYQRMVARAGVAAKFTFLVHSHMLRHACGFKLANDGHDTRAIQAYLGHRSIMSTVRYTALTPNRFKNFWKD